jgi:hypothetical protein
VDPHDQCDACGQRAYTAWWKASAKGLLLLCLHHTTAHELSLTADGWELTIDERHLLDDAVREPEPA